MIGRNVDEATSAVEKFIDRAFLAGLTRVRDRPRQRDGYPPKGATPVFTKASARSHRGRASAERRRRRRDGRRVKGIAKSKISPQRHGDAEENRDECLNSAFLPSAFCLSVCLRASAVQFLCFFLLLRLCGRFSFLSASICGRAVLLFR